MEFCLFFLTAAALAAPAPGTFQLSDPTLEGRMEASLERTLGTMNFAIRFVAKPGLEAVLEPCQVYFADEALTVPREISSAHLSEPLICDYQYRAAATPSAGAGGEPAR